MTDIPFQSTDPKYDRLVDVLHRAYLQAAAGKGKERHANDLPFESQPMQSISQLLDSPHGLSFQAVKKIVEGVKLPTVERQTAELLGAINYLAGLIIFIENEEYGCAKQKQHIHIGLNAKDVVTVIDEVFGSPAADTVTRQATPVWRYHAINIDGTAHLFTHKPMFNHTTGRWEASFGLTEPVTDVRYHSMTEIRAANSLEVLPTPPGDE